MLLMGQFLIELVEHANKDEADCAPLPLVYVVPKVKDARNHRNYFARRRNQRKNVLLKVSYDVVDAYLANHLENAHQKQVRQN